MFSQYLEKLRSTGNRYFTSQKILEDLSLSADAARAGLYRLKKVEKLISPISGLLNRQNLYHVLSKKGNPALDTFELILKGLGYKLAIQPYEFKKASQVIK